MINVTFIALLLVGCATDPEPLGFVPPLYLVGDPVPPPLGWEPLGTTFGDAGLDECYFDWYKIDETDCQITIGVVRVPMLRERAGTNARTFRDQRRIEIDSRLAGIDLDYAVAHEVGHILLDTSEHTPTGIMSGYATEMSADDWALACRTIGRGC